MAETPATALQQLLNSLVSTYLLEYDALKCAADQPY